MSWERWHRTDFVLLILLAKDHVPLIHKYCRHNWMQSHRPHLNRMMEISKLEFILFTRLQHHQHTKKRKKSKISIRQMYTSILWESMSAQWGSIKIQFSQPSRSQSLHLPRALITGTDRTLHVAVTYAPHFFINCVNTHPLGEQPSCTRIRLPMQFVSSNSADCSAVSATQPAYGRLAAPSKPMINGFREMRDSGATTNCEAQPAVYHGAASHTSSPISKPLFALRPTPSTIPAHARPNTNGNSWWSYVL